MKSQSQAVVEAINEVVNPQPGVKVTLTPEQKAQVRDTLIRGFRAGEIRLAKDYTDSQLRSYTSGLINNWLNKSKALNGNTTYQPKNPGSRSGSPEYKQAMALKAHLTSEGKDIPAELEAYIEANRPQPKAKPTKELDISALPTHLQGLAS